MARTQEFRQAPDRLVKTPSDAGLFGGDDKPLDWLDLPPTPIGQAGNYPYDGKPVWLGEVVEAGVVEHAAVWRSTRAFNKLKGAWTGVAFWAKHNAGGQRIEFEPLGYREFKS